MRKNIVVITGGPGFGKSSLIEALSVKGFQVGGEAAREIIGEQMETGGETLPWKNRRAFQQAVSQRRIDFWESVDGVDWAFVDRGIPDQLAFASFRGFEPSAILKSLASEYQYFPVVFICPPWNEIYVQDEVRTESFDEACRIHEMICKTYNDLGYRLVDVPLCSLEERCAFILSELKLSSGINQ
ncbi:AAA family ATPase [Mangrovibacterium diazotrophicum]|uniref:Putative ATPase n=1 Tax=Mangrovibacterium diazotrophicum TaxID=1261403 RepID=A0A419VUV1_9BACT|nr:AAA family ATPase [Mangrovibacterium diazotrophicum]RKD85167.1 putative ATPase [Mangrovibacterium diazotrophicum]